MFPIFPKLMESPVDSSSLSFCFSCQPRVGSGSVTCVVLEDIMDLIYLLKATPKSVVRLLASYAPKVDTTIGWWVSCTMRSFSFFLHFHDCGTSSFSTWPVSHIAQWFSRKATVLIEMILCNCITMYNYSIHLVILLLWVLLVILLVLLLLLLLHYCFCNYGSSVYIHFYITLLTVMFSIVIGW